MTQWIISEPWPKKLVPAHPNGWPKRETTNPSKLGTLSNKTTESGFMSLALFSQGSLFLTLFQRQAPKTTFSCKREMEQEVLRLSFASIPTAALEECSSRKSYPTAKTSSTLCQEKGEPAWWLSGPTVAAGCQNPPSLFCHLCYTTLILIQNEINTRNIPQKTIYLSGSIKVYRKTGQCLSVVQPILNFLLLRCNALGSCITTALNTYGSCTPGFHIFS